jgi:tRNA threonylcarbamoyladenosine biosynthesis protein TsaB
MILNIDTAVAGASVCLSDGAEVQGLKTNPVPGDSAAWLHEAIRHLLAEQGLVVRDLDAVAVSAGPGSYTGLRIGMAAAKGLCYSASIPLIAINTLEMMAAAATGVTTDLLCPMIDARRMEVFTAVYTTDLKIVRPAGALILQPDSFSDLLQRGSVTFFGNGSAKFQPVVQHRNAVFLDVESNASQLALLAHHAFLKSDFADLAYSEPLYGKNFFSPAHNQ